MKKSDEELMAPRTIAKQIATATLVPLFILFGVPVVSKIGTNDVTLKVGGAESATVMYEVGDATRWVTPTW